MKILHLIDNFDYCDGCGRQVFLLAKEQKTRGHEVFVAFGKGTASDLLRRYDISHFAMLSLSHSERSAWNFVRGLRLLRKLLKSIKPDIIHAHHFYAANQARIVRNRKSAKFVQTVHSGVDFDARLPQFVGEAVIAVSQDIRRLILRKNPELSSRLTVIPNSSGFIGSETEVRNSVSFQHLCSAKVSRFVVSFIGRIEEEKGIWLLVDALRQIISKTPILLCVVGKGSCLEEMARRTKSAAIDAIFFGEIENIRPVLEQSEIFVLPSLVTEGYPMVLVEAGLMKKAVIATRVGGIPEIISHGSSGLLVSPGRSDELADAIQTLYTDESLRQELGFNLQQTILSRNSIAAMTDAVQQVYQSLESRL